MSLPIDGYAVAVGTDLNRPHDVRLSRGERKHGSGHESRESCRAFPLFSVLTNNFDTETRSGPVSRARVNPTGHSVQTGTWRSPAVRDCDPFRNPLGGLVGYLANHDACNGVTGLELWAYALRAQIGLAR